MIIVKGMFLDVAVDVLDIGFCNQEFVFDGCRVCCKQPFELTFLMFFFQCIEYSTIVRVA